MPANRQTRVLSRADVTELLTLSDCITAVEDAFRAHAEGRTVQGILGIGMDGGGFHIKAAALGGLFAVKVNGNFFGNQECGLPRIQGLLVLCDATNGSPRAVMDSSLITQLRTGAATAVAAKYLARPDAGVVTIVGCGLQGRIQLQSISAVRPVREVFAYDADRKVAEQFARDTGASVVQRIADGTLRSDIVITCTPAKAPILSEHDVRPGTFVAAVGADSPEKWEIAPALMARAGVVPDILEQAATIGDLHHAIEAGVMRREDARAELGLIVAGLAAGRSSDDEIIVFDSTGSAIQDVAAAALVLAQAEASGRGTMLDLM